MDGDFRPGFRISIIDVLVLLTGSIFTAVLFSNGDNLFAILIAFVVGHFFLFCNVFRICRRSELIWATAFVLLSAGTFLVNFPPPATIILFIVSMLISLLLAAYFIFRETRKASYHGIFWQKWNPNLKSWWEEQRKAELN